MHANFVKVALSGSNDKLYTYLFDPDKLSPNPGDRVVLPSKLKDDDTISLCLGTVKEVGFGELEALPDGVGYKPVIAVVPAEAVEAIRGCFLPPISGTFGGSL